MDHESLHEDYSDSEINDQSMSISEGNKSIEINQNENTFEDILKESKSEVNASYPNKAYADLIILVTKYKLSNIMDNAIINMLILVQIYG